MPYLKTLLKAYIDAGITAQLLTQGSKAALLVSYCLILAVVESTVIGKACNIRSGVMKSSGMCLNRKMSPKEAVIK